jgi:hypothetical protein
MATATLNKNRVTSARVDIPAWGCWYAEASVDKAVALSGQVTLKIADLTLSGTVLAGGEDPATARSHYRIVGGKGGWGRTLQAKSYANDAGQKILNVISDAARECGETLDASTIATSERCGPQFARPAGPASQVLEQLKPAGWYVGEDGVTRIGSRAASTPSVKATITRRDKARGVVELATETLASLLPGCTFDGVVAVDVKHEINDKGLRTTIWGKQGGTTSRRLEAERKKFEALFPNLPFLAPWEYRVVLLNGSRLDLQPVRRSSGMPDLQRVPMRPGVSGSKSTLVPGCRVIVQFIDGDPFRPEVTAFEDSDGSGFKPLITEIDANTLVKLGAGLLPVARTGDLAAGIFPVVTTQVKVVA